ncbi:Lrp/AsnC family transcriptional regulator [Desulfallas thermosapovorans]|uniref:siroheme decarboxylase n=1 Tax=Desulfallas thermosapovorans DSM 6562 TaxID=1121431 RepID=A0A5S4ZQM5_9FIRM|nr:Lrp/AsnC family transcriptional regulator [Desulfallas thermosapovorans]TYO94997.1 transcriptional regulator, AsnC family [Desulfallas thermosapovorans DSM 6562]
MLTELEKKIVRELQQGLPLVERPYQAIAQRIGLSEKELMIKINEMISNGMIRRFGAALRHQDLGFTANAMVVWDVPEERAATVGRLLAGLPEVTHCYQRPRQPGWPYTIFTVIHGQTRVQCEQLAKKMAEKTGVTNYKLLFSTAELKKSSMKYFID